MTAHTTPVLPTKTKMNPRDPSGAEFYDGDQVAYVMKRTDDGVYRLVTSFGRLKAWGVGTVHKLTHDQTGGKFGDFIVEGVANFKTPSQNRGEIPNKKLAHWVVK
jgi:hypothetical protein